jgi:hypothetical protein
LDRFFDVDRPRLIPRFLSARPFGVHAFLALEPSVWPNLPQVLLRLQKCHQLVAIVLFLGVPEKGPILDTASAVPSKVPSQNLGMTEPHSGQTERYLAPSTQGLRGATLGAEPHGEYAADWL